MSSIIFYDFFDLPKYLMTKKPNAYLAMLPTNIITILSLRFLISAKVIAAEKEQDPASYKQKTQTKLAALAKADGWVFQTDDQNNWYSVRTSLKSIVIPNAINPDVLKQPISRKRNKTIVTARPIHESEKSRIAN